MNNSMRLWAAGIICAACIVAASPAGAQGRGFGRGFGGTSRVQLCSLTEVQSELKLTDDQKKMATELNEKLSADRREAMQNANGDFAGALEKINKLADEASGKLSAKLDDAQKSRLAQLFVQVNGSGALADSEVQKTLKISDEQAKKLADARAANRQTMMTAFQELRDLDQDARRKKTEEMQKSADDRLFACISAEQKAEFEKLGGAKLEIDLSPLAPRRPNN